jgi:alpha-N-arabinofuranosidase
MTCIAQMINVLQAMILTQNEKMVLTPTYHVFRTYKVHQGATFIPTDVEAPAYTMGDASIPTLHATASRDDQGVLHISLVNLDPNRGATVNLKVSGEQIGPMEGTILTSDQMNAMNDFSAPDVVKPFPFKDFKQSGAGGIQVLLPPKSVVVIGTVK